MLVAMTFGLCAWVIWGLLSRPAPPVPAPLGSLFSMPAVSQMVQLNYNRGPDFPCPAFAFSCRWLDEKSAQELIAALRNDASWTERNEKWVAFLRGADARVIFMPIKLAQPKKVLPGVAYEVRVSLPLEGTDLEVRHWFDVTFQPNR